jgi:HNH endonuclease
MIACLPDGREVTVTETPGGVFKAAFAGDPDGLFGYGPTADAAIDRLADLDDEETLQRDLDAARKALTLVRARMRPTGRYSVHHIDGNPYNNGPGNLMLADVRGNFPAEHIDSDRLENPPNQYLPGWSEGQ